MVGAQPIPDFPEYRKAAAREHLIRVAAGLNLTEKICGLEVMPLTPYHLRFLSLVNSPFLIDEIKMEALAKKPGIVQDILAFLWIISPLFTAKKNLLSNLKGWLFNKRVKPTLKLGVDLVCNEILSYVQDAFIDYEPGTKTQSKSYFSEEVSYAHELSKCHGYRIDYQNDRPRKTNPSHVPLK